MKKRILIPAICNLTPHLETELEIIEEHLSRGDDIFYVPCRREMKSCYHYLRPTFDECFYCRARTQKGISLLSKKINIIRWPTYNYMYTKTQFAFPDVKHLMKFSHKGNKYGISAASQLMSDLKDDDFDTIQYAKEIQSYIESECYIYNAFKYLLHKHTPNLVYIFNGRFPISYAAVLACKEVGINFFTHERAYNNRYSISYNTLPHDRNWVCDDCISLYNLYGEKLASKIAYDYYQSRRHSDTETGITFTMSQKAHKLPANFNYSKKNITYFNSSEFEYAALPKDMICGHSIYESDADMLYKLSSDLLVNNDIHIYCRIHPNLADCESKKYKLLLDMYGKFKNITIIRPEDDIDTYELMQQSSIIIANVSTMGIESAFWGKPVVLIGKPVYNKLEGFYQPHSHEELIQLLLSDLKPLPRTGAIMYGLWLRKGGIAFRHFSQTGFHSGTFKGVDLDKAAIPRYKLARAAKILLDLMFFYGKEEAAKSARKVAGKLAALLHIH